MKHALLRALCYRLVALLVFLLAILSTTAGSAASLRTVAISGQHAPGTGDGALYQSFSDQVINNAGQVAVHATLRTGSGDVVADNNVGIWSEGDGTLSLIARTGTVAAGAQMGQKWITLDPPVINNLGQVAFRGGLPSDGSIVERGPLTGIWVGDAASLSLRVLAGDQAPGVATGGRFLSLSSPAFTDAGQVTFQAYLKTLSGGVTNNNNSGVWQVGSNAIVLIAREGDQAPGTSSGVVFDQFDDVPAINSRGQLAFRESLKSDTGGLSLSNNEGIWSNINGSLELVARRGDEAPGTPPGVFFRAFSGRAIISDDSRTVFSASLGTESGGVTEDAGAGVWFHSEGTLTLDLRAGDPGPGSAPGTTFSGFSTIQMTDTGYLSFVGILELGSGDATATNNLGIWAGPIDSLLLIARKGDMAPGATPNLKFDLSVSDSRATNRIGQVAFRTFLVPEIGVGGINRVGIWATDRSGTLQLIALEGQSLEIAPGDIRIVQSLSFHAGSGFNDSGQVAFQAVFTDNSRGAFVSNIVAIPEPASVLQIVLACALWPRRNWRISSQNCSVRSRTPHLPKMKVGFTRSVSLPRRRPR